MPNEAAAEAEAACGKREFAGRQIQACCYQMVISCASESVGAPSESAVLAGRQHSECTACLFDIRAHSHDSIHSEEEREQAHKNSRQTLRRHLHLK